MVRSAIQNRSKFHIESMSKCSKCNHDLEHSSYAFCTECGTPLVPLSELPTLPNAKSPAKKKRTKASSVDDENKKLKDEIEKLKTRSSVLFGTTEEEADNRVKRILTVSGFTADILGRVANAYVDHYGEISYRSIKLPGYVNEFKFYKKPPRSDIDSDEIKYVATYRSAVDLQKELADIRLLLSACSVKDIGCTFVLATNEDLTKHRSLVMNHFRQMKTVLAVKKRALYTLELWDQKQLLKLEYDLMIKVIPKAAIKRVSRLQSADA